MAEGFEKFMLAGSESSDEALALVDKLFQVAQPGAVFSAPVTSGEYTLITASEVMVGMGVGAGGGGGTGRRHAEEECGECGSEDAPTGPCDEEPGESGAGYGVGAGGGGFSTGRPVALISVGPQGLRVDPIVDATKIGLAFFTTLGAMLLMLGRMRRCAGE